MNPQNADIGGTGSSPPLRVPVPYILHLHLGDRHEGDLFSFPPKSATMYLNNAVRGRVIVTLEFAKPW